MSTQPVPASQGAPGTVGTADTAAPVARESTDAAYEALVARGRSWIIDTAAEGAGARVEVHGETERRWLVEARLLTLMPDAPDEQEQAEERTAAAIVRVMVKSGLGISGLATAGLVITWLASWSWVSYVVASLALMLGFLVTGLGVWVRVLRDTEPVRGNGIVVHRDVALAYEVVAKAPDRLRALHASEAAVRQVERLRDQVDADTRTFHDMSDATYAIAAENGDARPSAKDATDPRARPVYERILRGAAETLVVLGLAEEREAWVTSGAQPYGPESVTGANAWGSVSLISAARELATDANLVRQIADPFGSLADRVDGAGPSGS